MSIIFRILCALCFIGCIATRSGVAAAQGSQEPAGPDTDIAKKKGNLSDKLNSTNGVIHPKGNVDPGIAKPATSDDPMPVIPPPGDPGGDPRTQPK